MKIYLAGSCSSDSRTQMVHIACALRERGHNVYCPFELKIEDAWNMSQEDWAKCVFDLDAEHLRSSEIMIMISPGRVSTAGTNWEQGFAYAHGIPIVVVQTTNAPTSLMTYCAADWFYSADSDADAFGIISEIAEKLRGGLSEMPRVRNKCRTVLT